MTHTANVDPNAPAEVNPTKYSKEFWQDLGDRSVSSAAGAALSVLGAGGLGIVTADWQSVVSISLMAGAISILKAFAVARR